MKKSSKKTDSIVKVKSHIESMKKELDSVSSQLKLLEQKETISDWEKIEFLEGKSIKELKNTEKKLTNEIQTLQKEIRKSKSKALLLAEIFLLPVMFLLIVSSGIGDYFIESENFSSDPIKTRHLIENLRGDTVDTWKSWRLVGTSMNVNIVNSKGISENKIQVISDAINSNNQIVVDDSLTHKGPKGSSSTYYNGWSGALKKASEQSTKFNIPTEFNLIQSFDGEGDIIITLSNLRDTDGYTGYTKSIVDGNEILKSFITIYDISNLSDDQLSTIVRHEFGHALGLGHSTAPEDLMAPTIDMTVPYISECNIAAIVDLYNGIQGSTICEK